MVKHFSATRHKLGGMGLIVMLDWSFSFILYNHVVYHVLFHVLFHVLMIIVENQFTTVLITDFTVHPSCSSFCTSRSWYWYVICWLCVLFIVAHGRILTVHVRENFRTYCTFLYVCDSAVPIICFYLIVDFQSILQYLCACIYDIRIELLSKSVNTYVLP